MVVADHTGQLDPAAREEVSHDCFVSGLARLEVAASQEGLLMSGPLDHRRVESVLGRPVQIDDSLLDGRKTIQNTSLHLHLSLDHTLQLELAGDVLDSLLGVGGPQDDHLLALLFELVNVLPDLVYLLLIGALEHIISPFGLVAGDEASGEDALHGLHLRELLLDLVQQHRLQHSRSFARLVQVQTRDVPPGDHYIVRLHQRHQVLHRLVHVLQLFIIPHSISHLH